jgi:SnoaL-like domain
VNERIADRFELAELRARYNHTYDSGQMAEFAALFADDAECEMGPGNVVVGVEAVRQAAEKAWRFTSGPGDFVRHVCDLGVSEFLDDDHATGRSHVLLHIGRQFNVVAAGTYHDRYVRVDGAWRFASRRVQFEYFGDDGIPWPPRPE